MVCVREWGRMVHSSPGFSWCSISVNVNSILSLLFKNLGAILDSSLSLTAHFQPVRKFFWLYIQNKSRIWPFILTARCSPAPPPLLISQLDYCDSLPTRLPAQLPLPPSVCSQHSNHSDRGKAYVSSCHSFVLLLFSYFSLQVAAWPPLSTPVLVIYCWVTNYCQPSNLNNTHLFFYSLSESGIWTLLSCLLCSGYHKAAVKVLPGLYPYLEACIEKDWLPSPFGSPAEFISL